MPTWLAPGLTATTSATKVTLAAGADSGIQLTITGSTPTSFPALAFVTILKEDGVTSPVPYQVITGSNPAAILRGPGTFSVQRPDLTGQGVTVPVGVDSTVAPV